MDLTSSWEYFVFGQRAPQSEKFFRERLLPKLDCSWDFFYFERQLNYHAMENIAIDGM